MRPSRRRRRGQRPDGRWVSVAMLLQPCPPAEPADRTHRFTRNCVILACPSDSALSEHRRLDRRGVERACPANASDSRMRASFHRRTAAEPSAPQPAPVKSDCRRLARVGAISPLLSAAPAQSIVAQPEQLVLLGVSGSQEAFAVPFSQAVFSLNRSSVLMAA